VALDVIGDIEYTGTITDVSDIRLKENIKPLKASLEKILSISGFYFDMIDKKLSDRTEIGVSAQDVEKVFPELVSENNDGYKGVAYSKFTPILIEALKELRAEKDKEVKELADQLDKQTQLNKKQDLLIEKLTKRIETLEK